MGRILWAIDLHVIIPDLQRRKQEVRCQKNILPDFVQSLHCMCLTKFKSLDCEIGHFFEKEAVSCCIIPKAKKNS